MLSIIVFILTVLLPAFLELKRPRDAGPRIIPNTFSKGGSWHERLCNIEPFIPDSVAEEIRWEDYCIIFGLENLENIENFSF